MSFKVVLYSRVSTEEQDPRSQLTELQDHAAARQWRVLRVFEENISGSVPPLERPVFRQALEYARENDADAIVLYDLTRFYRAPSPLEALRALEAISREVPVIFIKEPETTGDPLMDELWQFLKSWYASYERRMISLRTRYGLARVKREGRLYHKPGLEHYYAAVLYNKPLKELKREEVEAAKNQLKMIIERYLRDPSVKRGRLLDYLARRELADVYIRYPQAPRKRAAFYKLVKRLGIELER